MHLVGRIATVRGADFAENTVVAGFDLVPPMAYAVDLEHVRTAW
jgi:hypothetical protein